MAVPSFRDRLADAAKLHRVIDRRFAFDEAIDAFRYLDAPNRVGKVVIAHAAPH
jgi:NADPH:quinone reductase-like Zn-dependent oxidoreductase